MIETLALVPWETARPYIAATLIFSYLLGSIPFGLIFGWLAGAGDIRKIGSGNIGATNVLRTGKRWAAFATLLADAGKGYVAVRVAGEYFGIQLFPVLAGLGVVLGHMFPVWLGFKGGKGVATFIGVLFAFGRPPIVAVLTCLTWLTMAWATRYSSVAALAAATLAPLYFLLLGTTLYALLALVLAILIIFAHRTNILRLLRGDEPKIGRA
ncbi:MAG TPA: glycerol-3-phosphate 1-O-acyltransferase PlsY [Micropepsaceae bacterium]|jgi:glycerol-3-phosphate acyltransferase PlsY|nr:glycerol-3-phosphate 1-O-acyltransferase PlsY [Micropepsaceae bacterium]